MTPEEHTESQRSHLSKEEKEQFRRIYKISGEILRDHLETPCGSALIRELSSLTWQHQYMRVDRRMMLHYFERFEKLKRPNKKQEAWRMVIYYVTRLHGHAA